MLNQTPEIIHEDQDFLIVNKPPGMVVHHDSHHHEDTVMDFIKKKLNFPAMYVNPGILHRLDKPTSGLLIIAKNLPTLLLLKTQMQKRKIKRKYYALAQGIVPEKLFKVDVSLTKPGKNKRVKPKLVGPKAVTYFKTIKIMKKAKQTLLECELETGRTHQIRGHLQFLKFPIVNDTLYHGGKNQNQYIYLHAFYLRFTHPLTKKKMEFKIPLPAYFKQKIMESNF